MKAFRVWIRETGFIIEGVEWSNNVVFARRLEWPGTDCWEFASMGRCRDYILAAFGPDAHVVMCEAGELRFSAPGLLPQQPSEPGSDEVTPPPLAQPETPEALPDKPRRSTRKQTILKAIT